MMTLYHGSYISVPSPLTSVGRKELDFGQLRFANPTHQMCISRQAIVDRYLRFVSTEAVTEKGGAL